MGNPIEKIEKYILGLGVKKAVNAGVKAFLGLLGSAEVVNTLAKYGISVASDGKAFHVTIVQATFISALIAGIFLLANYIKTKFNIKWL